MSILPTPTQQQLEQYAEPADRIAFAKQNSSEAIFLYDRFKEVGNTLGGFINALHRDAMAKNDNQAAEQCMLEWKNLARTIDNIAFDDIDAQTRSMAIWRFQIDEIAKRFRHSSFRRRTAHSQTSCNQSSQLPMISTLKTTSSYGFPCERRRAFPKASECFSAMLMR